MKKLIFFAFLLLFSLTIFAQATGERKNDTVLNYTDILGKKQGQWIKHYPNGQVRFRGFFIDDVEQGTFTHYHRNGRIMSVLNYDETGGSTVEMFWESGNRAAKGAYNSDRERVGLWELFYKDGRLLQTINYKNGKADGNVVMYYPGTNVKLLDCNYKDAKLNGEYRKYFNSGLKMEVGNYKDGLKHGYYTYYNADGFKHAEGEYTHGRRTGDWIKYERGEIQDTVEYINGRPENYDELMQEWFDREQWAKENQHKFRNPHDYFDNPYEFFRDRPDPYEQERK